MCCFWCLGALCVGVLGVGLVLGVFPVFGFGCFGFAAGWYCCWFIWLGGWGTGLPGCLVRLICL